MAFLTFSHSLHTPPTPYLLLQCPPHPLCLPSALGYQTSFPLLLEILPQISFEKAPPLFFVPGLSGIDSTLHTAEMDLD
jgi:hypothetical protein